MPRLPPLQPAGLSVFKATATPREPPTARRKNPDSSKQDKGPQVLTFALQHRARATRASVPKVRTGCITCKKRHVKCDETRPACERCIKWQGHCEGYDTADTAQRLTRKKASQRPAANSRPVSEASDDTENILLIHRGSPTQAEPDFNSSVFANDGEKMYFTQWCSIAQNIGGGFFNSHLFTKTIPQLCNEQPSVRYAAIAIGALAIATSSSMNYYKSHERLTNRGPHYRLALTYYGRALKLVRLQQQHDHQSTIRSALLSCLLFICFEALHGNPHAVLNHISHGMHILTQLARSSNPTSKTASFADVLTKSPLPFVLEDEVMQVFQRLNYQVGSLHVLSGKKATPLIKARIPQTYPLDAIPSHFTTTAEARAWWDLVQHWLAEFSRDLIISLDALVASSPDPAAAADTLDLKDVPGARDKQKRYEACVDSWQRAFWPLYSRAMQNKKRDEAEYLACVSLQIQYLLQWISVQSLCFSQYDVMYQLTPQFRELVRLTGILLPRQPTMGAHVSEAFTLDNGPTMAVFVTATKCRDERVRDDAMALLKKFPRRDGLWDSRAASAVSEANKVVEMENMEGDLRDQ